MNSQPFGLISHHALSTAQPVYLRSHEKPNIPDHAMSPLSSCCFSSFFDVSLYPPQSSKSFHYTFWTHDLSSAKSPRSSNYFLNIFFIFLQPQLKCAIALSSNLSFFFFSPTFFKLWAQMWARSPFCFLLLLPVLCPFHSLNYSSSFETHVILLHHVLLPLSCPLPFSSSCPLIR